MELIIAHAAAVVVNRAAEEAAGVRRGNYWWHGEDRWSKPARPAVGALVMLAKP